MKKERGKKKSKNNFLKNLSNRTFYSFVVMSIIILLGVSVYAYNSGLSPDIMGHDIDEIQTCPNAGEILKVNAAEDGWECSTDIGTPQSLEDYYTKTETYSRTETDKLLSDKLTLYVTEKKLVPYAPRDEMTSYVTTTLQKSYATTDQIQSMIQAVSSSITPSDVVSTLLNTEICQCSDVNDASVGIAGGECSPAWWSSTTFNGKYDKNCRNVMNLLYQSVEISSTPKEYCYCSNNDGSFGPKGERCGNNFYTYKNNCQWI